MIQQRLDILLNDGLRRIVLIDQSLILTQLELLQIIQIFMHYGYLSHILLDITQMDENEACLILIWHTM